MNLDVIRLILDIESNHDGTMFPLSQYQLLPGRIT